jgi:hypothetical protein
MPTHSEPAPDAAYGSDDGEHFHSSALTRGPWHPNHQHAGPPVALVCRAFEQAARPHGLTHLGRLTANLFRPVPLATLRVVVQTDQLGRNAGHFSASLLAGHKELGRFTALLQRETAVSLPDGLSGHPLPQLLPAPVDATHAKLPFSGQQTGYGDLVETRVARGRVFDGPSAVWFRLRHPLLRGEAPTGNQRVAVAADSGNGVSAVLDFRRFSFVNADLTIHLLRPPVGAWVGLDARTHLGENGCGLAESALYDVQGLIGRATQSLMVRPRAEAAPPAQGG